MATIIGIDFDNTIAIYDELIHKIAVEQGLIPREFNKNKKLIRDHIRTDDNGEMVWQKIQSIMYGERMQEAELSDGFLAFMAKCKEKKIKTCVVSHKTQFAACDETKKDLRLAALRWMENQGFFQSNNIGLMPNDVYFEDTRIDKLERIRRMQCKYFIDDLDEVFLEPAFPVNVKSILYAPFDDQIHHKDIKIASDWIDIAQYIFSASD